ncbi:hypothetical protein pb186bvf_018125 [Paramecium bursaria]
MENQSISTFYQRVTPEMIPHMLGRTVCLVGKFKSFRDGVLCLNVDNSTIQIVDIDEFPETNDVLEIRGKVNERGQIEAQEYSTFKENFGIIFFL